MGARVGKGGRLAEPRFLLVDFFRGICYSLFAISSKELV